MGCAARDPHSTENGWPRFVSCSQNQEHPDQTPEVSRLLVRGHQHAVCRCGRLDRVDVSDRDGFAVATDEIGTSRLEAFSDGVMAVIITITALSLKAPDGTGFSALGHPASGPARLHPQLCLRRYLLEQPSPLTPSHPQHQRGCDVGESSTCCSGSR